MYKLNVRYYDFLFFYSVLAYLGEIENDITDYYLLIDLVFIFYVSEGKQ